MRTFVRLLAAAALAAPLAAAPARAEHSHKVLPPAFGKELVPDQSSQVYKGPSAEIEERIEEEKEERAAERPRRHRNGGGRGGRAGRIRIQLDGDEGGGGSGLDSDF